MNLVNAKTVPSENHKENGNIPPLGTQLFSPHSPLTDNPVALYDTPPRPCVEARDDFLLARKADLGEKMCLFVYPMLGCTVCKRWEKVCLNPLSGS